MRREAPVVLTFLFLHVYDTGSRLVFLGFWSGCWLVGGDLDDLICFSLAFCGGVVC